jgi:hypothetical protein
LKFQYHTNADNNKTLTFPFQFDTMAGQSGQVRQIQDMEDAIDNAQFAVVGARNRTEGTGYPAMSAVGDTGDTALLSQQAPAGTNR